MSKQKYHSSMIVSLQHLGRTNLWTKYGSGYSDAKTIGKYKVEFDEEEDTLRMFIWSKDRPCVVIALSKSEKVAVFDGIYYSPECTVDGKMKRGEGTREMIQFALDVMKANGAEKVELSDKSTVTCNGKQIKLGYMYFFKYGQTWYEKYFGFQPINHKERYMKAKEIQKTLGLQDKPCDYFTPDVIHDLILMTGFTFLTDIAWELKWTV
jgi:hypothetical protein